MSVLIQIISVTTYSLSIAIVALSRKRKYHLQDFASRGSLTLLWFLCTANTNYFDSIEMELVPLIIIIPLRIISPLLFVVQKIAMRCRKTSKDVTLNHNGSAISDPFEIAEVFNRYFSNIASNLDRDIPHSNIFPLYFPGAPVENSFCSPPLTVKKLLI